MATVRSPPHAIDRGNHTNGTRPTSLPRPSLPSHPVPAGPCNYRDMRHGRHARNCGCQRYWPDEKNEHDKTTPSEPGSGGMWCFCGHHACYHNLIADHVCPQDVVMQDAQEEEQDQSQTSSSIMQTKRLNTMLPPSGSPSGAQTSQGPSYLPASRPFNQHLHSRRQNSKAKSSHCSSRQTSHPRSQPPPTHPSRGARSAPVPVPSGLGLYLQQAQHHDRQNYSTAHADHIPSTRSASWATELASDHEDSSYQSFYNRALVPASHMSPERTSKPLGQTNADDQAQSATEVDTPSIAGTPVFGGIDDNVRFPNHYTRPSRLQTEVPQPTSRAIRVADEFTGRQRQASKHNHDGIGRDSEDLGIQDCIDIAMQHPGLAELIESVAFARKQLSRLPSLVTSIEGLTTRVGRLEDVSFFNDVNEEVNDKLEFFEGRVIELEGKVDDFERVHLQSRSSDRANPDFSRMPHHAADMTFASSNFSSFRDTTIERLRGLEERLDVMRGPTASQPRQVEVVFMPWGYRLKGLWFDDASRTCQTPGPDTADSGRADSSRRTSQRSSIRSTDERTSSNVDDEWSKYTNRWLSPRACGPTTGAGGLIYDRLKSRGFVRDVTFYDGSARHIQASICTAFRHVLSTGNEKAEAVRIFNEQQGHHVGPLLGFASPFVPLRKIHKSSRLRFLSAPELATPSLWTMSLLETSIFMKAPTAGVTRLYITTPMAYLQPENRPGWTWQHLRELPKTMSQETQIGKEQIASQGHVIPGVSEADAMEPCWAYQGKLDSPPSNHSSFASDDSYQRYQQEKDSFTSNHPISPRLTEAGSQERAPSVGASSARSSTSDVRSNPSSEEQEEACVNTHHAPITPLSEYPLSSGQPRLERRTASFPVNVIHSSNDLISYKQKSEEAARRCVTSFDIGATMRYHSSPVIDAVPISVSKRRRLSRSSEDESGATVHVKGPWALTPRRSREPSSPGGSSNDDRLMLGNVKNIHVGMGNEGDQSLTSVAKREKESDNQRQAAHAYATPHSLSGGSRRDPICFGAASGDTDVDMSSDDDNQNIVGPEFGDDDDDDDEKIDEDEVERVLTMDEEAWEGVGGLGSSSDDDDDDENNDADEGGDAEGDDDCDDDDDDA